MSSRIAIVDGGSFLLPYDFQLIQALAGRGIEVDFFGSRTRYNPEFLDALRAMPGLAVHAAAVSGTVSPRWKGVLAYAGLLARLLWNGPRYRLVNLQFSVLWPLELAALFLLRRKLAFTVHNAVPHGFGGPRHRPTMWLAALARTLVFVSEATREDFMRRYGERFRAKAHVVPHGLLPVAPQLGAVEYQAGGEPKALVFWSSVRPYKGVELFEALARSDEVRRRGLSLEVYGAWSPDLAALRRELAALGVRLNDGYLDQPQLAELLARDAVFLLPYRAASQSGALYSLLNHGRVFICADVGDLGDFMRRHGLEGLLLRDRSAQAVLDCLDHLAANREALLRAFQAAQQRSQWGRLLAQAHDVYGAG